MEADGVLRDPAWWRAVADTPRHIFVDSAFEQDPRTFAWTPIDVSSPAGLDRVYSPETLVTTLADRGTHHEAISSSTNPDLMIRMLEALDIRAGHRVLEIGTGTGYNAALLCARLGDPRVFSVDIDSELVDLASERLARTGFHPTLAAVDGVDGLPGHAPYDRIIATCSVPAVPWSWAEQLTEGGLVLVDLKVGVTAGNLVLLQRHPDRLEGRFLPEWAGFMTMRHHTTEAEPTTESGRSAPTATRVTTLEAQPSTNLVAWFIATLNVASPISFGYLLNEDTGLPQTARFTTPDGSWAEVALDAENGVREVREGGPRALWAAVEQAHALWTELGEPGWERLGLTVTRDEQWAWVDDPDRQIRTTAVESQNRWHILNDLGTAMASVPSE
jgi:methyltransferase of ATP-grasp peptide maturase system